MINKVSLIGLGGIGAAYASKLYELQPTILQVVANKERIKKYKDEGITINGKRYDFHYILPETPIEPADLVLIAVKYDGLDQALNELSQHIGPKTIIVSLMNGITSEEIIAHKYPNNPILPAMCVAIDAIRSGTSVSFTNIGRICFGENKNETLSSNVIEVKQLFDRASIPYEIPEDMLHTMWWKFMINVGINQTSAVLKAPYKVFQEIPEAHNFMYSAMKEVIELAQKEGVQLTDDDFLKFDKILKEDLSPEGKTSMLQDVEARRKTEVEYLAGTVCKLGKKHRISTPVNDMLFNMIRVIEKTF
ncbi:ketopantoate reductase family protein [Alkalihalobacillus sp. MEB130]|uniref:ketopantoate reductase family protein n=1 Tax=Alkalihalobacillus sp. MEB130 TaxID=2976704 RepID=UPI0028DD754E|nr:ketopantoate reductase family protein [Alkalihalobacillus sp. MEB130]MDT8859711.1 ketopantoate reductase family protein [Alkalihalobacillus sp. MEB130]